MSHLADALNDVCALERGSILNPVALAGVACLVCPPMDVADTASLRLLIFDADHAVQPGWRVVYGGRRHVVTRLAMDADGLTELTCREFDEPA